MRPLFIVLTVLDDAQTKVRVNICYLTQYVERAYNSSLSPREPRGTYIYLAGDGTFLVEETPLKIDEIIEMALLNAGP